MKQEIPLHSSGTIPAKLLIIPLIVAALAVGFSSMPSIGKIIAAVPLIGSLITWFVMILQLKLVFLTNEGFRVTNGMKKQIILSPSDILETKITKRNPQLAEFKLTKETYFGRNIIFILKKENRIGIRDVDPKVKAILEKFG